MDVSMLLVIVLLALGLATLMGFAAWRLGARQDAEARSLMRRVARLPWRAKARLAWALLRDGRVPFWLRAVIPALVLYLAMPIDLIPDFIPVLGHLDDVLVVVLAVGALVRFTPRAVLAEHLSRLEGGGALKTES